MYYIGIDLGTTNIKLLLLDESGTIVRSYSDSYPIEFPHPGWSQQRPEDWWTAVLKGLKVMTEGIEPSTIKGIGCGGQMHGLVVLDENDQVIRPAILWNDGRTEEEVDYLNHEIGQKKLTELTANIAFAGFTAPKLLWMKKHEPDLFARIHKIMLPKDYINYQLSGVHSTDYSDASGMLLLDVKHKDWSDEMLKICGITRDQMPRLFESYEVIGTVKSEICALTGLCQDTLVVAGAGDNAAAAIGTGTVTDGSCNISLGTSGTLFIAADRFCVDPQNALHAFAHATGRYHLMGCILSAASCNSWFCDGILQNNDYQTLQGDISDEDLGRNHVFFLPYLMGERSPINDTQARGAFVGLSMENTQSDMLQAVLEGVGFALRDCLEIARASGLVIHSSCLCGGGSRSPLWRKILADILNVELVLPKTEEGPAMGGAMLAMVGSGLYPDVAACCRSLLSTIGTIQPDPEAVLRYEDRYQQFKKIYPALKVLE